MKGEIIMQQRLSSIQLVLLEGHLRKTDFGSHNVAFGKIIEVLSAVNANEHGMIEE